MGCPSAETEPDRVLELSQILVGCEGTTEAEARARDLSPECEQTIAALMLACRATDLESLQTRDEISDECEQAVRGALRAARGSRWIVLRVRRRGVALELSLADLGGDAETLAIELVVGCESHPVTVTDGSASSSPATAIANVLDYSASMSDEEVDESVGLFDRLWRSPGTAETRGEVVLFSADVRRRLPFTDDRNAVRTGLQRDPSMARASTSLYDAIGQAVEDLADEEGARLAIVATDGAENSSRSFDRDRLVAFARQHRVRVLFWGSLLADHREMADVAERTGGTFLYAPDLASLGPAVDRLAAGLGAPRTVTVSDPRVADATEVCVRSTTGRACVPIP